MATSNLAAYTANIANTGSTYDQLATMQFQKGFVGNPLVTTLSSNTALTTGNAVTSEVFTAPANCFVYATNFTVLIAGTGATSNLTVFHVSANNGANTTGNTQLGNVVFLGANVAGNVGNTGPYTYNVFANGAASSTNTANQGGFFMPAGDVLVANSTGNLLYAVAVTQYKLAANALYVA